MWMDDTTGLLIAASYQRLQQDAAARPLAARALARANAAGHRDSEIPFLYWYDADIEQAWTVYLLQRHFGTLARELKPSAAEALLAPLREQDYNTLHSGLGVLALEAYGRGGDAAARPTLLAAGKDGKPRAIGAATGNVVRGDLAVGDTRAIVRAAATAPAWYVLNESGFDRVAPAATQSHGLEVIRDYVDDKGNAIKTLAQGDEVTVRIRVRGLGNGGWGPIAIVDLLPGGFEVVMQPPPATEAPAAENDEEYGDEEYDDGVQESEAPPAPVLALPGSTLVLEHAEPREDRVVLYAYADSSVQEFRYKVRANNVGTFVIAPVFGEAMYRPRVYAQGGPAGTLTVTAPKK
jgi:alpha-2-macroglobulin